MVCRRRSLSKLRHEEQLVAEHRAVRLEAEVVPLERRLGRVDAGEGVGLGVEFLVAEEFEDRAVEGVAARLGDDVHLRALVTELGRVDAGLDLELLDRIDRRQGDVVVEVRVGVTDAVERVVVEEDALTTGGDGLRGALAAKSGAGLPRRGREHVDVGRDGDQIQVLSAVQRQLGHDLVLDHRTERGALAC